MLTEPAKRLPPFVARLPDPPMRREEEDAAGSAIVTDAEKTSAPSMKAEREGDDTGE